MFHSQADGGAFPVLTMLGGAELVSAAGGERLLGPGKPLALLTYLHCSPGRTDSRDHLLDLLWADQDPERARHSLRQTTLRIRQLLGADALVTRGDVVVLGLSFINDRDRFVAAIEARSFDEAIALYRGPFFEGFATPGAAGFEQWADAERRRLHAMFVHAAGVSVRSSLAGGRHREAIALARRVRDADRDAESSWRLLLDCLGSARDRLQLQLEASALEELLRSEGREPEPATRALLEMARGSDPDEVGLPERGFVAELVGREREFGAIIAAWEEARRGQARHLHFEAPAGLGKTRLLEDAGARLATLRARVVVLRAHPGERDLAWSFAAELAQGLGKLPGAAGVPSGVAAHLVALHPALAWVYPTAQPQSLGPDLRLEHTHAIGELLNAVLHEQPVALLLDDLHWLDRFSHQVLQGMLARLEGQPLLIVSAARNDYLLIVHGPRTTRFVLPALNAEQVVAMLSSLAMLPNREWGDAVAGALQRAARGSPLLLLETLQRALERGELKRDGTGWSSPDLPALLATLEAGDALRHRVAELPAEDRRLLLLLAVAGVPLGISTLSMAFGSDPADRLGRLELRGLAGRGSEAWAVGHDEIAETVIGLAGDQERRFAHASLGRAIIGPVPEPPLLQLAARHLAAGEAEGDLRRLVRHRVLQARQSREKHRPDALVTELLGPDAARGRIRDLVRALPFHLRFGLTWRDAAGFLVLLFAAALIGRYALLPGLPPDALFGMGIFEGSDFLVAALPVRLDDWRPDLPLKLTRRDIRYRLPSADLIFGWMAASPDGRLAYNRIVSDSGRIDVFLREPDGTERRLTSTPRDDLDPSFSPDGRSLLFRTARWSPSGDDDSDIALMDLATGTVHQLTRGPATDTRPVWSPDGTRVGFVRRQGAGGRSGLCWVTVDGLKEGCLMVPEGTLNFLGWAGPDEVFIQIENDSMARMQLATGQVTEMVSQSTGLGDAAPGGEWLGGTAGPKADSLSRFWIAPARRLDLTRWVRLEPGQQAQALFWWPEAVTRRGIDHLAFPGLRDSLPLGVPYHLGVRGLTATGDTTEVPAAVLRWRVSDTSVALINDSTGVLSPRRAGRIWIIASAGGWRSDSVERALARLPSHLLWEERWADSTMGDWRLFGDPKPLVVRDEQGEPAFWQHGDEAFLSGAYSALGFSSFRGIGVEFVVSTPVNRDKWQRLQMGIAAEPTANVSGFFGRLGEACALTYPRAEELDAKRRISVTVKNDGTSIKVDPALGDGHRRRMRIQLFPDGTCGVAIDGRVLAHPTATLRLDQQYHLFIEGQSVGTRMLVGPVEVWEGVRDGVEW